MIGLRGGAQRTVTAAMVDEYCALTGDTDPLHTDDEFARTTPYRARIAPGALIIAVMMAAAADATGDIGVGVASVGFDRLRHTAPVMLGDEIRVAYEIVTFDGRRGHAQITVTNQHGETVAVADHLFAVIG
jgi:3-hydroxybutyryl-CoA dehydratase